MGRTSIIFAAGLILAACAASEPPRVRSAETLPPAPAGPPPIKVEPIDDLARTLEVSPSGGTDAAPRAGPAAPGSRFRTITERAPMADATWPRARRDRARFRPVAE